MGRPRKTIEKALCTHYWIIDSKEKAICKLCGAEQDFRKLRAEQAERGFRKLRGEEEKDKKEDFPYLAHHASGASHIKKRRGRPPKG